MKRELKAAKPTPIRVKPPTKSAERELADVMEYMVDQITKRFKNGAIKGLQAGTVEKFADAQAGNYAKVFLKLASRVQRSIVSRFDDDRIEAMVFGILDKVDNRSRDEFYSAIEGAIGISSKELAATEGMKATTNALKLETAQWVKKLRDETLEMYTSNALRAMSLGNGLDGILDEFEGMEEKRKNHAKTVARTQINTYNSLSTKIRAQNLGITQAVWVTANDERVRPSHAQRDGKVFDLDKGLYSSIDGKYLLTGVDYGCRCTARYVLPGDDG